MRETGHVGGIHQSTLSRLLEWRAQATPRSVAHRCGGGDPLSFSVWHQLAHRFACGLRHLGIRRGHVVALAASQTSWIELAVAYIGTHRTGGICLLVSETTAESELSRQLASAEARFIVGIGTRPPVSLPQFSFSQVLTACPLAGREAACESRDDSEPHLEADIIFTSGTTGTSRPVVYDHANAAYEAGHSGGCIAWEVPAGLIVHAHPPHGAAGQGRLALPLLAGLPVLALGTFNPRTFAEAVSREAPPHVSLLPAAAGELTAWAATHELYFPSVQVVTLGSSSVDYRVTTALRALFANSRLVNQYTSTEALPSRLRGELIPDGGQRLGQPDHMTRCELRDPATGTRADEGSIGEIWLRTPGVTPRRYLDGDDDGVFVEGWTRTGDLGRMSADGCLEFTGRSKELIIRGGLNVSPVDIEVRIRDLLPDGSESCVFGYPHPALGEEVGLAIVGGTRFEMTDIEEPARKRLSEAEMPKRVLHLKEFPRGPTGKVLRRKLSELLATQTSAVHQADVAVMTRGGGRSAALGHRA